MRIESADVSMSGSSSTFRSLTREVSLRIWTGSRGPGPVSDSPAEVLKDMQADILDLSDEALAFLDQGRVQAGAAPAGDEDIFTLSPGDRLKIDLVEKMMEILTGKKFKFIIMDKLKVSSRNPSPGPGTRESSGIQPRRVQGPGLEYRLRESYYEQERMSFSAGGLIKTSDGRELAFSLKVSMSREFASENNITIRAGEALVDPLVINFDGGAPGLTEDRYSFDLDADGSKEQIAFARSGSGFLALDLNGDGKINDGGELFGPTTGSGFSELAGYDLDGNGWIDENDPVYGRLRIWTRDSGGGDALFSLGDKGIGAIYLGNVATGFSFRDQANNPLGQAATAGVCLKEDGTPVTVQQIDLFV